MKKCSNIIIYIHTILLWLVNIHEWQLTVLYTCLMAMETRMELMELSMRTLSFSFLLTVTGVSSSSLLLLGARERERERERGGG